MDPTSPLLLSVVAALVLLVAGLAAALVLANRDAGRRSRRRNATAQWGEAEAEALLEDKGYCVVDRQLAVQGTLWVNGEPEPFGARLDLVAERDGVRYVVEVKTGRNAPDPAWPATRRQLREYAVLMPDHEVLLVDMDAQTVLHIDFDGDD
jgi:Holliday junction resolvase-like predicted endonuclease